jgi:hypothetical protein
MMVKLILFVLIIAILVIVGSWQPGDTRKHSVSYCMYQEPTITPPAYMKGAMPPPRSMTFRPCKDFLVRGGVDV